MRIGSEGVGPLFIGLKGPLGSGKSVLARAIARGAGVEGPIPSPTFNLLFRYEALKGISVVHVDLYRLTARSELWELGWEELGSGDELTLVEWPERAGEFLPEDRWEVELSVLDGDPARRFVAVNQFGHPRALPGFPVRLEGES
jgi:tRNA threonylcarbamoyl adenosine modification protein YjeE